MKGTTGFMEYILMLAAIPHMPSGRAAGTSVMKGTHNVTKRVPILGRGVGAASSAERVIDPFGTFIVQPSLRPPTPHPQSPKGTKRWAPPHRLGPQEITQRLKIGRTPYLGSQTRIYGFDTHKCITGMMAHVHWTNRV